jgi:hypothetical protein
MASPSLRRSDRVSFSVLLEVSGTDGQGQTFNEPARTLILNRSGAVMICGRELAPEQEIHVRRKTPAESHRQSRVRVVNRMGRQRDGYLCSIEILDPDMDLWGVDFPEPTDATDAVAKMLLECSYCRSREVAYLSELELRAFEINRGVARHCRVCGVASIWTQAANEDEKKMNARAARARRSHEADHPVLANGEHRERQRMRLHTRLTACIRQSDSDDELAVCEDISPIGMCFRSKRRFDVGSLIDVAVPYSPDSANIFLPARVVYSEEIPKAGLFRHGTEYSRVGPRAR